MFSALLFLVLFIFLCLCVYKMIISMKTKGSKTGITDTTKWVNRSFLSLDYGSWLNLFKQNGHNILQDYMYFQLGCSYRILWNNLFTRYDYIYSVLIVYNMQLQTNLCSKHYVTLEFVECSVTADCSSVLNICHNTSLSTEYLILVYK